MSAALEKFLAANKLPEGMELFDLQGLINEARREVVFAGDMARGVTGLVRQVMANATAGGITFTATDVAKLLGMLELVAGRIEVSIEACDVALQAQAEGLR